MSGAFFGELYLRSTLPFLSGALTAEDVGYLVDCFCDLDVEGPIVDLGCGHGRHGGKLQAALPARVVVGIERDPYSLARCEPGFSAVQADFFALPFASRSLAGAYAWYSTLFSFEDRQVEALLREIARCLQPGGKLVFQTAPYERILHLREGSFETTLPDGSVLKERTVFDPRSGQDRGRRELGTPDGRVLSAEFFIRYYPLPQLTRLVEEAGFTVVWIHGSLDRQPLSSSSTDLIVGVERKHG